MGDNGSCPERWDNKDRLEEETGYPSDCELTQGLLEKARNRNQPVTRNEEWKAALPRARNIRLLLLDVDGVLTDGTIIYTHGGGESKGFHTQDGFGLSILRDAGIEVGLITARTSKAVSRRAQDLHMQYVYQGNRDKKMVFEEILQKSGLQPMQIAYMGDDWLDLHLLNRVGFSAAPANAVEEIKRRVHYVTMKSGGRGAVREICELILEARGQLAILFKRYL